MESKDVDFSALAARLQAQSFSSLSSLSPLDLRLLGSSHMTWKERKALENQRVVSLGGKPVKQRRVPLSVAKVTMKKQKEREQKTLQEGMVLGRFAGKKASSSSSRVGEKRKVEDRVLRSSEGHFKNGVLNVKHLLRPTSSRDNVNSRPQSFAKGKKKQGGGGKKRGGGRKQGKKKR